MDIKLFKQYLANNTALNESLDYTVVRHQIIADKMITRDMIPGKRAPVPNPLAGQHAVLLKFKDGKITTGVGKNKKEAIAKAIESKATIFGEQAVKEAKSRYPVLHDTLHSAIQTALTYTKKDGYEISDEEEFNKVTTAYKNLGVGKTDEFHLELYKGGKPQRKMLHIQVYRMDTGRYELNFYVS